MKRIFKYTILFACVLCLFGCSAKWSDVKEQYGDILSENPTCVYVPQSNKTSMQGIQKIRFSATSEGASATYTLSGSNSITEQFFVNNKFVGTHDKTGIPFYYNDGTILGQILDKYSKDKSCLDTIYLCAESGISGYTITTTKSSDSSCFTYYKDGSLKKPTATTTPDNLHTTPDGCQNDTKECSNSEAVYCKVSELDDINKSKVIIERGETASGSKYLYLWPYGKTKDSEMQTGDASNNFTVTTSKGDVWRIANIEGAFKKENCEYPEVYQSSEAMGINGISYFINIEGEDPFAGSFIGSVSTDYKPSSEYALQEQFGNAGNVTIPDKGTIEGIDVCSENGVKLTLHVVGYILFAAKLLVPLLLIIFGSIDFGKALMDSDDKAIKDASGKLIKRIIAGVVIFFLPTIFNFTFSLIDDAVNNQNSFDQCSKCLFTPFSGECSYTKIGQKE